MKPLKFVGVELRSIPQLIVLLLSVPAIMGYLVWDKLASVTISVSSSVFPVPITSNVQSEVLLNITKRTDIFMNFGFAQWKAFYNAISTVILFDFIVGGLLGAFILGIPIVRGTIIHDIATLGSKRRTLTTRTLFLTLCALLFASFSAVFLYYLPPLFGISPDSRFFLAVFGTSLLAMLSAAIIVLLLTTVSRELVVPVTGIFAVLIVSLVSTNTNHLLLPFKDFTFALWNPAQFGHPDNYMYAGFVLYGFLTLLAIKAFGGGDFY